MTTREELRALAGRVMALTGPDREVDAEIMFDLFARPVGQHPVDGGPRAYLWPEDDPSWNFGIRFPGKDRAWFTAQKKPSDGKRLVIFRDGANVLMNDLRVLCLTASLDAAMTLVPEGWFYEARQGPSGHPHIWDLLTIKSGDVRYTRVTGRAASPAVALTAAALLARAEQVPE